MDKQESRVNDDAFVQIKKILGLQDVILNPKSIKAHYTKGFMSDIFVAKSDSGELMIHILNPNDEQIKQQVHKKVLNVSRFLQEHDPKHFIKYSKVLCADELSDGRSFIVQERLKGFAVGKRMIINLKIKDIFDENKDSILKQAEKQLAKLHSFKIEGFGYLDSDMNVNADMKGRFKSWKEFLQKESYVWLETIYVNSKVKSSSVYIDDKEYDVLKDSLKKFFKKNSALIDCKNASLIHGDMINPGNFLAQKGKITGMIDFEWALAADPAYEFAFTDQYDLDTYFSECSRLGLKIDKDLFKRKIQCYKTLWLLWGTNVHAKGDILKKILFDEFKKNLNRDYE